MKAIGKNIVIRKIEETVKTNSGLILSADDSSEFRYQKGEVVMAGTDVNGIDSGATIFYDTRSAYSLVIDGDKVTIIQERDVVVVL